ncbi:MAG: type II toxin-antitoxin system PemK/MazF family toxin [Propionibacteriaceae bacterium]|nr:type II toxin-antitoxin system PemK/MazF family toxin [Propionibacteriaceae bacterium]
MKRGEIYLCDFGAEPLPSEAGFLRPAVVVSDERLGRGGPVIVLPVTSTRRAYVTHVELDGVLPVTSYVQCEQVRAISPSRLGKLLGHVDSVAMLQIDTILRRIMRL